MDKEKIRIVFMGTPEFAVESLRALVDGGYNVVGVITQPDKPVGRRGSVLRASAVKEYALQCEIPVLQPVKMRDVGFLEQLRSLKADIQVVVAFRMLPEEVWGMPRFGTFNVHASLLPQYRGAAPINWAIINGESKTGVTTFFLNHDIDTGHIIAQKEFDIPADADVEYVYDGLMKLGAELCIETVDKIIAEGKDIRTIPQTVEDELHDAPKIFKETCRIDWNKKAVDIYNFIRGLSPIPAAWTTMKATTLNVHNTSSDENTVLKIYKMKLTGKPSNQPAGTIDVVVGRLYVSANDEWIEILDLQIAGKKRMETSVFLNGFRFIHNYLMV